MEGPPPEFFEALEKYPDMENAKLVLKGEDVYSKSLLALILTRLSEDNDTQVAEMLSSIDTKDNDIAMMLCFMTHEYRLETKKAKNLIFKRFGKPLIEEAADDAADEAATVQEAAVVPVSNKVKQEGGTKRKRLLKVRKTKRSSRA
jgi:hypothetical protein